MAEILVAEDDAALRLLYTVWLESSGRRVTAVADGREAIAAIQRHVPDAVVLDVEMPFVDGLAVGRYLHGLAPDVPILFVTALEGLDAGEAEVLSKPCSREQLVAAVDRIYAALTIV